jgi:hypothetical protein
MMFAGVACGRKPARGGFRIVYLLETIVAWIEKINLEVTFARLSCVWFCG